MKENNPNIAAENSQIEPFFAGKKLALTPDGIYQEYDSMMGHLLNYGVVQQFRNLGESHAR